MEPLGRRWIAADYRRPTIAGEPRPGEKGWGVSSTGRLAADVNDELEEQTQPDGVTGWRSWLSISWSGV